MTETLSLRPIAVVTAFLLLTACGPPAPPTYDPATLEPQVAARIDEVQAAVEADRASAEAWARLGRVYHAHELNEQAVVCYRASLGLAPDDYELHYLAGVALEGTDPSAALREFEQAAALQPPAPLPYTRYGQALAAAGESEAAEEQFRQALELDSRAAHAELALAQLARRTGDDDLAREHLDRALAENPRMGVAHELLAEIHEAGGEAEQAEIRRRLAEVFADSPAPTDTVIAEMEAEAISIAALTTRAARLQRSGRAAEAEALFRQVLELRGENRPRDLVNLASALRAQNKLDEAVATLQQALALAPEDADVLNGLGLVLLDQGLPESAEEQFDRLLAAHPDHAGAYYNLGLLAARQGRTEEATERFRKSLELAPRSEGVLVALGVAQASLDRPDEAAESWRAALAINPAAERARYNLTRATLAGRRHGEAIELLEEGLRYSPDSEWILSFLAWERATAPDEADRDPVRAVELASTMYRRQPDNPEHADVMAAALAAYGSFQEAVNIAEHGMRLALGMGNEPLAEVIRTRLDGYRNLEPYRQSE